MKNVISFTLIRVGILFATIFVVSALFSGCVNTPPDRIAYNTIGSLDSLAKGSYSGYVAAVLRGDARTNEVPEVSIKYNQVEGGLLVAATVASQGTNSIAPPDLSSNVISLVTYIGTLIKK